MDGQTVPLGSVSLSREQIVAFASEFDPQPFHLDDQAARATLLGGQAASGWHTCLIVHHLLEKAMMERSLLLRMSGAEDIRWRRPVRPGDTLSGRIVFSSKSDGTCSSDSGIFGAVIDVTNQHSELVASWHTDCNVLRSAPSARLGGAIFPPRGARVARVRRRRGDHAIKFFDDVEVGDEIDLGDYTFTNERVAAFRDLCESNPQCPARHAADLLAERVHDWHVVSAWMHSIVRYYRLHSERLHRSGNPVPLLGPAAGVKHLRWHAPVRVGETISYSTWAERKLGIATREDWGLLIAGAEGVNAAGQTVVSFYPQMLLQRFPSRNLGLT